jgi:hypothetical protein
MHTPTLRLNGTVIDPAEAVRSAKDLQAPDPRELLRGLDSVPARVDSALSAAGDSLRETGDQIRDTIHELSAPRRSRRLPIAWPWLVGLAAGFTVIGVGAWWFRRSSSPVVLDDDVDLSGLDREDLDRATSEGMGTAPGATDHLASPSNGSAAAMVGVGSDSGR